MKQKSKPEQLLLFDEEELKPKVKRPAKVSGCSQNPIVFRDYESYVEKFTAKEKTTDDTYTPRDVYEAVVQYVSEIYDMTDKVILRPFYPGGDYENAEYPENGVVIDNPPFSIFTKIVKFYCARGIQFFMFGPGLTIFSACRVCTAVIVPEQITFENGALVKCNFATNLMGDTIVTTAVRLAELLEKCDSQNKKVNLPSYEYPAELLSCSDMQTISRGDEDFSVSREEAHMVNKLGVQTLFGEHLLISKAKAKAKAKAVIKVYLNEAERRIVDGLEE